MRLLLVLVRRREPHRSRRGEVGAARWGGMERARVVITDPPRAKNVPTPALSQGARGSPVRTERHRALEDPYVLRETSEGCRRRPKLNPAVPIEEAAVQNVHYLVAVGFTAGDELRSRERH